jgi:hypothetical protein
LAFYSYDASFPDVSNIIGSIFREAAREQCGDLLHFVPALSFVGEEECHPHHGRFLQCKCVTFEL